MFEFVRLASMLERNVRIFKLNLLELNLIMIKSSLNFFQINPE